VKESTGRNPSFAVVIVAAGKGVRYGPACKVLEMAAGKTLIEWSIQAATNCPSVQEVVVVAGSHSEEGIDQVVDQGAWPIPVRVVCGGRRRQDSVAAGVAALVSETDVIVVHDGARPLVESVLFTHCADAAWRFGAAIAATKVSDTLKRVSDAVIVGTVDRNGLWAAQTPQAFRRDLLLLGMNEATDQDVEYTDEASLMESLGHHVAIVAGSRQNIKVTMPEDLELVDALLRLRRNP
jgi:2-C-methyl-D-erythritol 4-phosphate cytidylyltransferase